METKTAQTQVNAQSVLLPYALTLIVGMVVVQVVIALTGGVPTVLTGILTAVVALGIVFWYWKNLQKLSQIRFSAAIAHTLAFVTITTSYNLHAMIRIFGHGGTEGGLEQAARELFTTPWFGTTFGMTTLWGLGLLLALLGSIASRGWRD